MALQLITQSELIENLADRSGWSKGDVKAFLTHLSDEIEESVQDGRRVKVAGVVIGPVVSPARKKRMGRNPQTGEEVPIPAKPASAKLKAKIVKPLKDVSLPSVKRLQSLS
jgi:DNA-binding protein HU-beta